MKSVLKIIVPSILMLLLIYLWRSGKDILTGIYIVFPVIYVLMGIIYSKSKIEFVSSLILLSISFLVPINLMFNMGYCIDLIIIYNILSVITFLIKKKIKK